MSSAVPGSLESHGLSLPGSSVHGIFQTSILQQVAISFSSYNIQQCLFIMLYVTFLVFISLITESAFFCLPSSNSHPHPHCLW